MPVNGNLPSLTGLRFFAAFSIMFAHATTKVDVNVLGTKVALASTSLLGMPLFFVLSGFVIHYNYGRLFEGNRIATASRVFLWARFSRLYPLYVAALSFALWHDDWLLHVWEKFNRVESLSVAYALNIFSWFPIWVDGKLLIQHNFGVAWSISTEWFFYIAYIFFAGKLARLSREKALIGIVLVCGASLGFQLFGIMYPVAIQGLLGITEPPSVDWMNSFYRWFYYVSPYSRIYEFLLGAFVAQAFLTADRGQWPSPEKIRLMIALASLALCAAFIGLVAHLSVYHSWPNPAVSPLWAQYFGHLHMNFALAPFIAFLIYLVAIRDARDDGGAKLLTAPLVILLGEASYSLYLLHPIALRIVPLENGALNIEFRLICAVIVAFALAIGGYQLIEVPCRRYLRRFFRD